MNAPANKSSKEEWQKEVDKLFEGERSKAERAKDKAEAAQDRRNLKRHQRDFVCHVCGQRDSAPALPVYAHQPESQVKPSDLKKCEWCHRWTCPKHLYRGICSRCVAHQPLGIKVKKWLGSKYLDEKELQKLPLPPAQSDQSGPAAVAEAQPGAGAGFGTRLQRATAKLRSDWARLRKARSAP